MYLDNLAIVVVLPDPLTPINKIIFFFELIIGDNGNLNRSINFSLIKFIMIWGSLILLLSE